jgi:hypothetical protein
MRKMKSFFILITLLIINSVAKAKPISSVEAKATALNFYILNVHSGTFEAEEAFTCYSSHNDALYYIFNIGTDNGFVIIAADDASYPVIGYSPTGSYNASRKCPPEFSWWMNHYAKQLENIMSLKLKQSNDIAREWNTYFNNVTTSKKQMERATAVSPLIKTIWAQSPYFNDLCPDTAVAGCVATAMAQIMKYWAYPPHGIGSNTFYESPYGSITADFDTTHYNWSGMPDNVVSPNHSVALISYDCGVGVGMNYNDSSSSAWVITGDTERNDPYCAQIAFVNYFGYNGSAIQGLYKASYSYSNWLTILENELNSHRPLIYVGEGNQGGHAWVCDGYNANDYFHMNWGWGGYLDSYYTLDELNPSGIPLDSGQEALIGIEPNITLALFNGEPLIIRAGNSVTFTDFSIGTSPITGWQWSFPGGVPSTSALQNPTIMYPNPDSYNVTETVTNTQGSNTLTQTNYVVVLVNNTVNLYPTLNKGTFTVELHSGALDNGFLELEIYTILGQKAFDYLLTQYTTTISIPDDTKTEYYFRAIDSNNKIVGNGKFVVQ